MSIKCDAMIGFADRTEDMVYCFIIYLDEKRKEACVRVGEDHDMHQKDIVIIEAYDEVRGVLFFKGTVYRAESDAVLINKMALIDEKQRRSDVRVQIEIPVVLIEIKKGAEVFKPNKKIFLEAVNSSAGGMLIKSDLDIEDEDVCLTYVFPMDPKSIICKAQIVRKKAVDGYFLYGCKLLNDENDRAELRKFVYKTQIKTKKINFDRD